MNNFKNLKAVVIDFDERYTAIVGPNGAGKSAILDSIPYLFLGAAFKPEKPIRIGAEICTILGRLDNGIVFKRRTTENDETGRLTIESEEGAVYKKPGELAEAMFDQIAFRPDMFDSLAPAKRAAMLRDLMGVDVGPLELKAAKITEDRKLAKRELEAATVSRDNVAARLKSVPELPPVEAEISIADLVKERSERESLLARNKEVREFHQVGVKKEEKLAWDVSALAKQIAELQQQLKEKEEGLANIRAALKTSAEQVAALVDPNVGEIDTKITEAEEKNKAIRQNAAKHEALARTKNSLAEMDSELAKKDAAINELSNQLKEIDAEKKLLLSKANMPVPGMSIVNNEVYVNDIPYSQISSSQRLTISRKISFASKKMTGAKAVRLCLIHDGDRYDDKSRAEMIADAEANDYCIIEERVARPGIVGLEIEDGHIKGAAMPDDEDMRPAEEN